MAKSEGMIRALSRAVCALPLFASPTTAQDLASPIRIPSVHRVPN